MILWEELLQKQIQKCVLHTRLQEVLQYAVLPAGKLFRPRLLEALAKDYGHTSSEDVETLGCALEIHHAYSLVHDDLPCMDNDSERRGKPSTHIKFGEWQALLAGDALLAFSYSLLENLKHPRASQIRHIFHWATGAKGLILGQWIDLGSEAKEHATQLARMHELKTARLMQVATMGAYLLSNTGTPRQALRLGRTIGLVFQWLDDLDDLTNDEISEHESLVNPFLLAPQAALAQLKLERTRLEKILQDLNHTRAFLNGFLKAADARLEKQQTVLRSRVVGWV